MMRLTIIGLLAISLALTANLSQANDLEKQQLEAPAVDTSAVLDSASDVPAADVVDEQSADLVTRSEPVPMGGGPGCFSCFGDCREDYQSCWLLNNCPGPNSACATCWPNYNGCIANCRENVC